MTKTPLIVGNWKMNGSLASNAELLSQLTAQAIDSNAVRVAVCVPFVYLAQVSDLIQAKLPANLTWGAQDVSEHEEGAYTGEVSAAMLRELGVTYVIVGHSERRRDHHETDSQVARKARVALKFGITPIVCVGETEAEREQGQTLAVVGRQLDAVIHEVGAELKNVVVAYEPIWAIGTGKTASPAQANEVHAALAKQLHTAHSVNTLLYGGSMNASNAADLLAQPYIHGGLIGGASLKAADFLAIARAAVAAAVASV